MSDKKLDANLDKSANKNKKKVNKSNVIAFKKASIFLTKDGFDFENVINTIESNCKRFTPAKSELYVVNCGFVPAFTTDGVDIENAELCRVIDGNAAIFKFRIDGKKVPAAALERELEMRLDELSKTGDISNITKEEKACIEAGLRDTMLERAFATTTEVWGIITRDYIVISVGDEGTSSLVTKHIRDFISLPIEPLSVLSAKNIYNRKCGLELVDSVGKNLNELIVSDIFDTEIGLFSKSSFTITAGGGSYAVANGDENIPELIASVLSGERKIKKATLEERAYSCSFDSKKMNCLTTVKIHDITHPKEGGDDEEAWFNGTALICINAFDLHIGNMSGLCAKA
ncbi:recombination-associated protein RdgC [Photobacterium damselae]|uniref:recombination-associated protein RdgC n=1 Tax=Photobacterium damselae TaxID=38293 RepID=UPI0040684C61